MIKEYKECILRKTYDFRNFKELQEFQFLVSRFLKIFTNSETLLSTLSPWSIAPSLPLPCAAVPFVWRAEPACYEILQFILGTRVKETLWKHTSVHFVSSHETF